MKKIIIAGILIVALVISFAAGILTSSASAGGCYRYCDTNTCRLMKCCAGNCLDMGACPPQYCPR